MLKEPIIAFAYPFGDSGDFTIHTEELAKKAGYTHVFSTEARFASPEAPYRIPRVCVEDDMVPQKLAQWVEGGYDLYASMKRLCVR
jgi:hypothetical protein